MKKETVYMKPTVEMNTYDSELVKSILTKSNFKLTTEISNASVALLNTCSVRENANNKVLNQIQGSKHQ